MIVCEIGYIPPHSVPIVIREFSNQYEGDDEDNGDKSDSDSTSSDETESEDQDALFEQANEDGSSAGDYQDCEPIPAVANKQRKNSKTFT